MLCCCAGRCISRRVCRISSGLPLWDLQLLVAECVGYLSVAVACFARVIGMWPMLGDLFLGQADLWYVAASPANLSIRYHKLWVGWFSWNSIASKDCPMYNC